MTSRVTPLAFDSEIFDMPCGRLELGDGSRDGKDVSDLVSSAWAQGMHHLVMRIPSDWSAVATELRSQGFQFVLCSLSLDKATCSDVCGASSVYIYEGGHDGRLREIAESAFTQNTRFHLEPAFARGGVRILHERWTQNLIEDDSVRVFVHRDDDVITGYVTVQAEEETQEGHIGLIAVDSKYHGRDIGGRLLRSMELTTAPYLQKLSVMTERINIRALRLYARAGYTVRRSWDVWHAYRENGKGNGAEHGSDRS